jgi:hypothetical protein
LSFCTYSVISQHSKSSGQSYSDDISQSLQANNEDEDAEDILPVSRGIFSLYCKICAKIMNLE